jgi:hypothetical protein
VSWLLRGALAAQGMLACEWRYALSPKPSKGIRGRASRIVLTLNERTIPSAGLE